MSFSRIKKVIRLFSGLYGNYKRGIVVLALFGVSGALLESFGVAMLIPLISHILQQPLPDAGFVTDMFSSLFSFLGIGTQLRFMVPFIAFIFIARAAAFFVSEYIRARITTDYERNTRRDLFRRLVGADWSFLLEHKLGYAENTLMVDVGKCTKLLTDTSWTLLQFSTIAIYAAIAVSISPAITLVTMGAGVLLLSVSHPLLRRNRRLSTDIVTLNKSIAHDVNESVVGFKAIKATGLHGAVVERVGVLFDMFRAARIKQQITRTVISVSAQPVAVIFILAIFVYSFFQPDFNLASFAVVVFLIQRIFLYVERVQSALLTINESVPNATALLSFTSELERRSEEESGTTPFHFDDAVAFEHVGFFYKKDRPVLFDVCFTIQKGTTLAIIGPSGVGKTTIADLLLRLITPTSGAVTVDGSPLSDIRLSDWRVNIGYVSQDLFLLNDTIFNNVRFYDDKLGESAVEEALNDAALGTTIQSLPRGIHTNVGERGVSLSAGQRQRIVLARILVRKPKLIILDEATSALDTESEQAILKVLRDLHGKVTIVIIAHRLSTVREADHLLMLEHGRIIEVGNPEELLHNKNSRFYQLHKN